MAMTYSCVLLTTGKNTVHTKNNNHGGISGDIKLDITD